jgi:ElaB/YqjD/DUF883 family membrane-anchored ribosome-binding protein
MDQDYETPATGASETPKSRMDRARDYVGSKYSQAKEKAQEIDVPEFVDQIRTYVRSNPGKALLISVAAGFVIGLLLRRRDDDD